MDELEAEMRFLTYALAGLIALWILHRLALWMESRGWIYYRRSRGRGAAIGNALLGIQSIAEPQMEHVLDARLHQDEEEDEEGDPPEGGGRQDEAAERSDPDGTERS